MADLATLILSDLPHEVMLLFSVMCRSDVIYGIGEVSRLPSDGSKFIFRTVLTQFCCEVNSALQLCLVGAVHHNTALTVQLDSLNLCM